MRRALFVVSLGCAPGVAVPVEEPEPTPVPSSPPTTDTASPPAETGDTGPEPVVFDCDTIPVKPVSVTKIAGASGYHDVAFTTNGLAIGSAAGNDTLLQAEYAGAVSVFVPGVGMVQQLTWLPDGDLATASEVEGIVRIAPNGGVAVINGNIRPYGLILGPDEQLYAANQDQVLRVDPTTGQATVIVPSGQLDDGAPRVIAFDLDASRLFIGTYLGSSGRIYTVDLDENLDPVSPPTVFVSGVGTGAYHDAIGVDLCGYLYIPDYTTGTLWRVSPSGQIQPYLEATGFLNADYGHGVTWGNGVGGWREDAIYLPLPYDGNKVLEVVVGVPPQGWTGGVATNLP